MTTAIPGAPIGPDIPSGGRQLSFDHVPKLRELVANGGWPGVIYAQACVHNLKAASDRTERPANLRPIRGATYYSIHGPKGEVGMALVGSGQPIQGAAPEGGERFCFVDDEVETRTGHKVEYPIHLTYVEPQLPEDSIYVTTPHQTASPEPPPPRVKRKYTRRKQQKVRGRFISAEVTHGARTEEPQPEGDGQHAE